MKYHSKDRAVTSNRCRENAANYRDLSRNIARSEISLKSYEKPGISTKFVCITFAQYCRLSSLAEHCEYGEEKDNMTRDQVLTHIKDKNLKSKLYRSENLTLSKLLEVVSQYHDKDALILVQPEEEINRVELTEEQTTSVMKFQGRC